MNDMETTYETMPVVSAVNFSPPATGADIILEAEKAGLDHRILYEAVIDLSDDGLQDKLEAEIDVILSDEELVQHVLEEYIPPVLVKKNGFEKHSKPA